VHDFVNITTLFINNSRRIPYEVSAI
jgi:hypothetical protein